MKEFSCDCSLLYPSWTPLSPCLCPSWLYPCVVIFLPFGLWQLLLYLVLVVVLGGLLGQRNGCLLHLDKPALI